MLFNCYVYLNLDIIEFTVYHQKEKDNKIFYPKSHELNHNHNFTNKIIYQPILSNIIFYKPQTKQLSWIICRILWNKIIKTNILLKTINYIGNDYYQNHYMIMAEDTMINIILFHYSRNYTNIGIPGYLYNIKNLSITRKTKEYIIKQSISFYLLYKLLYNYIKEFDKNRNYLYYELRLYGYELLNLKKFNVTYYLQNTTNMLNEIINDNKASTEFKIFIKKTFKILLMYIKFNYINCDNFLIMNDIIIFSLYELNL